MIAVLAWQYDWIAFCYSSDIVWKQEGYDQEPITWPHWNAP